MSLPLNNVEKTCKYGFLKNLAVAVFMGCLAFSAQAGFAADEPVPTLDTLHNSGEVIPGTTEVYPSSAYSLRKIDPADYSAGLPLNVIKYYNSNGTNDEISYYEVNLKYSEYGTGDSEKYFKWAKDEKGIKLVETTDKSEAVLTLKYNPSDVVERKQSVNGNVLSVVNEIYIAQDIKNAISSLASIDSISSTFEGGTIDINSGDKYNYSAIISEADGKIKNVNSSFVANNINIDSYNEVVYGTLVKSIGEIDNLRSEFIGNTVNSKSAMIEGGFIQAPQHGVIGNITSDFILNRVTTGNTNIHGAVIANSGIINNINGGIYNANYGVSDSGNAFGGVLMNTGTIGQISDTSFTSNYAKSGSGNAYGGVIYNTSIINEIVNTTFRDNYVSSNSGKALGGAIYSEANLKIAANNNQITEFSGNYIESNGVKDNQAIYIAARNAALTIDAQNGGRVIFNDSINGEVGYTVSLTGDNTGIISLYNNINNGNVVAANTNIDTADGKLFDYNFLTLTSDNTAKYKIDADLNQNKTDTFTLGSGSRGTIILNDLNIIGSRPAGEVLIQILNASDSVKLELSDDLISKHTIVTVKDAVVTTDEITANTLWSKKFAKHTTVETITDGIRAAVSSSDRQNADSIEFFRDTLVEEIASETLGDTLKLMNQYGTVGTRSFSAVNAEDVYTLTDNLGSTSQTGADAKFRVSGIKDGYALSTIDASGHTMFEIDKDDTNLEISNVKITQTNAQDGSILNISNANGRAELKDTVVLNGAANSYGIVNDGTLVSSGKVSSNTGVKGAGNLSVNGGTLNLTSGASIIQDAVIVENGGSLTLDSGSLTGKLQVENGSARLSASGLQGEVVNNGNLYLTSGTLTSAISTTGSGVTNIAGDVISNALIATAIQMSDGSVLTSNANYIGGDITSGKTVNLTGGTLSKNINASTTNITGDVTFANGINVYNNNLFHIAKGGKLTTSAANINHNVVNDSILNFTTGNLGSYTISGAGTTEFTKGYTVLGNGAFLNQSVHVYDGATLQVYGANTFQNTPSIINDSLIKITNSAGTLNTEINGSGTLEIRYTTKAEAAINQNIILGAGANFTISADDIGGDVSIESGNLVISGGTELNHDILSTTTYSNVTFQQNHGLDLTINGKLDASKLEASSSRGTMVVNADLLGENLSIHAGTYRLTGGTLNINKIAEASIYIQNNVVIDSIIEYTSIKVLENSKATLNADCITDLSGRYQALAVSKDGVLAFTGGTNHAEVKGDGTLSIVGDVIQKAQVETAIRVEDKGSLTMNAGLLSTNSITNMGNLYLNGTLTQTIKGNGTTIVNDTLSMLWGANIDGTLDLNNGHLLINANKNWFNLGTVIGEGDLSLNINLSENVRNAINLNSNSTAIFNVKDIYFLGETPSDLTDRTFQILMDASSAQLKMDRTEKDFNITDFSEDTDKLQANVYYDDEYLRHTRDGVLHTVLEIGTTSSLNDSIKLSVVGTDWGETKTIRGALLTGLNQFVTDEQRNFNFRTANDEYKVIEDLGMTSSGVLNINGVADETSRSLIDMDGHTGFNVSNSQLNISNTKMANTKEYFVLLENGSMGAVDADGNVSGGIINSEFTGKQLIFDTEQQITSGAVKLKTGSIISQIKDSVFKDNLSLKTKVDSEKPMSISGAALAVHGSQIGTKDTYKGGIINTVFEGNKIIDGIDGAKGDSYGAAILLSDTGFISNIIGSEFKNNILTTNGSVYSGGGGALAIMVGSRVHNIEDSVFSGNSVTVNDYLKALGGAIFIQGSTVDKIVNTTFTNNSAYGYQLNQEGLYGGGTGGAIALNGGYIGEITGSHFNGNYALNYGGAIYTTGGTIDKIKNNEFINNSAYHGGVIYSQGRINEITDCLFEGNISGDLADHQPNPVWHMIAATVFNQNTIDTISGCKFLNNKSIGYNAYGIGIGNNTAIGKIQNSIFSGNTAQTFSGSYGIIFQGRGATIQEISGVTIEDNSVSANQSVSGVAITNRGYIKTLKDSTFRNNYGKSVGSTVLGTIYNTEPTAGDGIIDIIEGCLFEGNHLEGDYVKGGAIYNDSHNLLTIVNTSFKNNHLTGSKSTNGAAIYTDTDVILRADGEGKISEISGNYGEINGKHSGEAIYIAASNRTLTLEAVNGGEILLAANNFISGAIGYKTHLTGDSTGTLKILHDIANSYVTAENTNISTVNNYTKRYANIVAWDSKDTARFQIDVDPSRKTSDSFALGNSSTGKMILSHINLLNDPVEDMIIRVIESGNSNIQLGLDDTKLPIAHDILLTLDDVLYNDSQVKQNFGYELATTSTLNDSIKIYAEKTYDALNIIGSSTKNNDRQFIFRTEDEYHASKNLDNIAAGTFTIKGLDGDETTSVINSDGHSLFNLTNRTQLQITNTKLTGTDDIINVANEYASINLKNAYIDGNIKGAKSYNLNINGAGKTVLAGNLENARTTMSSGILEFTQDTFKHSGDTLDVVSGSVIFGNGAAENYSINKLTSNANVAYTLDFDPLTHAADSITIADKSSSGTIRISDINFINEITKQDEDFVVQVLDTNGNNNIKLELDDSIQTRKDLEEISRQEVDKVGLITKYTDEFNINERKGILYSELYLTTSESTNDSLGVSYKKEWQDFTTVVESLGDTLKLVNQSDLQERVFLSQNATDVYHLSDDLGTTTEGTLTLDGVSTNDAISTINLHRHDGFVLDKNTVLNVNNTRITGVDDIITVQDNSSVLNLNNAYIDGNIKGNSNFNININGTGNTTITGVVNNADAVLSRGGLTIDTDTFADNGSSLHVNAGSVFMNNGEIENYNISNLISDSSSKYLIDVDLSQETADNITVGANSSGRIVLEAFNIIGGLTNVTADDEYTIQILNAENNDIQLQLSETVQSQIGKPIELGKDSRIIDNPITNETAWNEKYNITIIPLTIKGMLDLTSTNTTNDSLYLYDFEVAEAPEVTSYGDTLKLLTQLESKDDKLFYFNTAQDRYPLEDYIGTAAQGKMEIRGVSEISADNTEKFSVIDMNKNTGFVLSNAGTEIDVSNVQFENINFKDGTLFNISNENSTVNLNNVVISKTPSLNAIMNSGTLNMTGGNVILNSGISGNGTTNIDGASVVLQDGVSMAQNNLNVQNGSLFASDSSMLKGNLNVGESGSVSMLSSSITSAAVNAGELNLRGGNLTQNITGGGKTNIQGTVVNTANLEQNVDIQSGSLTTSANNITGAINNSADLYLTGALNKTVTGSGTTTVTETLTLLQGAGFSGELNLNNGKILSNDSAVNEYNIGKMDGYGKFSIDVDFTNNKSDKFIVGNQSSGIVFIDSLDVLSAENVTTSTKVQVLDTNGTDAIKIALNSELTKDEYKMGRVSRDEQDTVSSVTNYKDIYNTYIRGGNVYGTLSVGTTKTQDDSIVITAGDTKWDDTRDKSGVLGDTLALWNNLDTAEAKIFTFDEAKTYTVGSLTEVTGLGETKGSDVTINGVSENETQKSTIDLDGKTGFELANETTLNINNTKLTGNDNLITVSNENAAIKLNNAYIDGNIIGSEHYNVEISGNDVTTLNGKLANSSATLTKGVLKFLTETFKDSSDKLNANGGTIELSNNNIENYVINELNSNANAKYNIDVNLSEKTADTITVVNTDSTGIVVLDNLNNLGELSPTETIGEDYKIQILQGVNSESSLQLALSDELQNKLSETEYFVKSEERSADSEVKAVNNWTDRYYQTDYTMNYYGVLGLSKTDTINDSLGITITRTEELSEQGASMGDTLALVNQLVTDEVRKFNFDDYSNEYTVTQDLGKTTAGELSINGVSSQNGKSTVDLNGNSGFELAENTTLNINDTKLTGNETLITVSNENAKVNLKDAYIDGNLEGTSHYDVNINGESTTTLDGIITNANTSLDGGSLIFQQNTFADENDTLRANAGRLNLQDNKTIAYNVNELISSDDARYSIDVDMTTKTSDKIILKETSSTGTVYIDSISYVDNKTPVEEFKMQILDTNGNANIGLQLSDAIKSATYNLGEDTRTWDDLDVTVNSTDFFHDFTQIGTKIGSIDVAQTSTAKDSIELKYTRTEWDDNRITSVARKDTLKELNIYVDKLGREEKAFNFDTASTYTVKENLGVSTKGTLNLNGVSNNETQKSTIDLDGKTGFELANETTLNINNTKLTGNDNLITVSNENAAIKLNNAYIDGNITGSEHYNVEISGNDVTTLNGKLANSSATLTKGVLKFLTDTFKDSSDKLNANGGTIELSNNNIENYVINELNSNANAKYNIDVNLSEKTADTIQVANGTGTITLDNLNIIGKASDVNKEYKIQILYAPSNDLQLALSEYAQSQLDNPEYMIGTTTQFTNDEIKSVTNWKDIYNVYAQDIDTYGKLSLSTTDTTNDSLGIVVTGTEIGDVRLHGSMGDTLRLVNNAVNNENKSFEFDTASDTYKVSENLGELKGTVSVKGVNNKGSYSTIDMRSHSGFEMSEKSVLNISNTSILNAKGEKGSAIFAQTEEGEINLTNVSISGNKSSQEHGGAILSNSNVNITADKSVSSISGNRSAETDEAVYLGENAVLTLNSINNGKIIINDKVNGDKGYNVHITGDKTSNIYFNNKFENAEVAMDTTTLHLSSGNNFESSNVVINSGRLDLVNNAVQQQVANTFHVNGTFNLDVDVDLQNEIMDRLPANTTITPDAFIQVDRLNLLSDTRKSSVAIPFANTGFKDNVSYIGPSLLSSGTQVTTAFSPIFKYNISYENREDLGYFVFSRGSGSNAFNPAVLASPVANQVGSYAAINESFNYVFEHSDAFMMLPANQRFAMLNANKYAINSNETNRYILNDLTNKSIWVKSYATFENIGLKNGPGVDTTSYGTLVGGDGDLKLLKNGWSTISTAYMGYNGSSQHYNGTRTYQNGGLLGLTQTFYKENFFTAITASAGASAAESNTMYGSENFASLMAGVASKTGYNIEFKDGKFIVLPSMLLSYSFVNTFDYTNAAGVRMNFDPLHVIQLHPDVKFIANLKHGWQPYARVGVVWNILNEDNVTANDVRLPSLSIKPYVEYGVGIQKHWADRFTGYLQAMMRNGGRNGVSLTFGFRWSLGKQAAEKVLKPAETNISHQSKEQNQTRTSNKVIIKRL